MQQQPDGLLRTGPAGDVVQHAVWCLRSHKSQLLDTPQVVGLLLRLCTSSQRIKDLYDAYSLNGRFGLEQWLAFVSAEQAAPQATQLRASVCGGDSFEELRLAKLRFARKSAAESADAQADSEWSPLQFALQLLDRQNTVAAPARGASAADDLNNPLAHFWASCSHNSYIIGDQLTGISSAAAYRRQLLQDYRSLEIDCWDGAGSEPAVKHGHTLTTVEQFDEVARAIGECAFTSSELPVVLSLEMHCSPKQQNKLAKMMIAHFGTALLRYDELIEMGRALDLSPVELKQRVLAKGKVKEAKPSKDQGQRRGLLRSRTSRRTSTFAPGGSAATKNERPSSGGRMRSCSMGSVLSEAPDFAEQMAKARAKVEKNDTTAQHVTDEFYAGCLAMRSVPIHDFIGNVPSPWALPITSLNEDRLLVLMGLTKAERNQIEGLSSVSMRGGLGLSEAELSSRAIARLALEPPPKVGELQRRSSRWLLRPYPLGLRFSGKNMSPLPGWLTGAQNVCLNISECDLAMHLHFALFHGSRGFVLKPQGMLKDPEEDDDGGCFSLPMWSSGRGVLNERESDTPGFSRSPFSVRRGSASPARGRGSNGGAAGARFSNKLEMLGQKQRAQSCNRATAPLASSLNKERTQSVNRLPPPLTTSLSRLTLQGRESGRLSERFHAGINPEDDYWPPPREMLHKASVEIISLHNLPKRGEQRPRYAGAHSECHAYHPELSGSFSPPDGLDPSSPGLTLSLFAIGGFCAVSDKLPLPPQHTNTETVIPHVEGNGMNAAFGAMVHCVAAEPNSTFLRIRVTDGGSDVAYESLVLGRLRPGYRVVQMRGLLGTRIECCFLFVRVSFDEVPNVWATARQLRLQSAQQSQRKASQVLEQDEMQSQELNYIHENAQLSGEVEKLKEEIAKLTGKAGPAGDGGDDSEEEEEEVAPSMKSD